MENTPNTLLIVDDNTDLQNLTRELFESEGYAVYCASNGREALEFLRENTVKVDLIMLDLKMPVMDGFQFRKEQLLDHSLLSIPVVIVSADANVEIQANELKAQGFLTKAGDIDNMLAVIKALLP